MGQIKLKSLILFFLVVSCSNSSFVTFYKMDDQNTQDLRGGNLKVKFREKALDHCSKINKPYVVLVENNKVLEKYRCDKL